MTSQIFYKINQKSKRVKFEAAKDYRGNSKSTMPYEEVVVISELYPDNLFLVHKNMIFDRNSVCDSSYNVYKFDKEGNFISEEDIKELGLNFFRTMKEIKKL